MNLASSMRSPAASLKGFKGWVRGALAAAALALVPGLSTALAQDPKNWDFEVRTDKSTLKAGEAFKGTAGIVSRAEGPQGWSYGVKHDTSLLTIESVTFDGTDTAKIFSGGFNQTTLIEKGGTQIGYIQAIILSFTQNIVAPKSDFFSMAIASYKVNAGACDGKSGDQKAKIEFTETLNVPNSPPVDINLTVEGKSLVPGALVSKEVTVECGIAPPPEGLALRFDKTKTDLVADKTSLYDLKVLLANTKTQGGFDVQGWSYGVQLDMTELEPTQAGPGADSKALNGGKGPEFTSYDLDEQDVSGSIRGVAVGAVIAINPPALEVLPVGPGASKHIDTICLRSRQVIPPGGQARTTQIKLTDKLGGDRPLEVLVVVAGNGIVPDSSDTLTLNLSASQPTDRPIFIRGDANNDRRVDIADGIWIINFLFYAGQITACAPAADSNADGKRDLSDAMYIFNHQLQPGRTPGNLFPAPPAPYPGCGTADGVTFADCPKGSTVCMP
ncbi:MAG: hypothetical protein HY721_12540 [Planctomycetes bacterium]|nr:hypothetical protein [Planctomycetota bacterium]